MLPINELYTCIQGEGPMSGIPHILIRFVGCPLRCQFKNSFCDSSFNSWSPEKGEYDWEDIHKICRENPKITHVMITGGSPTMHSEILVDLVKSLYSMNMKITIETEGSRYVRVNEFTSISLSPKLTNSIPKVGHVNPYTDQMVTEKTVQKHNSERYNLETIKSFMQRHNSLWFKFVVSSPEDLIEIEEKYIIPLQIHHHRIYLMPEGVTNEDLSNTKWIVEECIKRGWNYSDRLHVRIYGDKRGV